MKLQKLLPLAAALIIPPLLLLTSCVTGGAHLKSITDLGSDQMVVAGKIVLDPPLGKNEQTLGMTGEYMRNLVYFFIAKNPVDPANVGLGSMSKMYSAKLGVPFFIVVPRLSIFSYSAPMFVSDVTEGRDGDVFLPGGLRYKVPPTARAVSIGTIVYHRDLYNDIKKVDLRPKDPVIEKAFDARFGSAVKLVPLEPEMPGK